MSSASSASLESSPLVRRMKPPVLAGTAPPLSAAAAASIIVCMRLRRLSRWSSGIFCDTPTWLSCGRNTSSRPAMLICVDSRAPLVPIGSLITCTSSDWPSNTCFSIGTMRAAAAMVALGRLRGAGASPA